MSKQLFNNPNARRGAALVSIPMHMLYDLMRARIERIPGNFDADAVCQNICVAVEEQQGTYPNLGGPVQRMGRGMRPAPADVPLTVDYAARGDNRSRKRRMAERERTALDEDDEDVQSLMDRDRE